MYLVFDAPEILQNQSPFPKSNPETMIHQAPKSNKEYIISL